jgi:hypothetical protein
LKIIVKQIDRQVAWKAEAGRAAWLVAQWLTKNYDFSLSVAYQNL